jgi:hypothetical protein
MKFVVQGSKGEKRSAVCASEEVNILSLEHHNANFQLLIVKKLITKFEIFTVMNIPSPVRDVM